MRQAPDYAGTGAYTASYYAASAHPAPPRPPLAGSIAPEVCIVGAGYTGLSAGIALAERRHKAVILEGARVGWGASGRNGGQIVNGLNAGLEAIARYGEETAASSAPWCKRAGRSSGSGSPGTASSATSRTATSFAAFYPRQMRELEARQALWRRHGHDNFEMLDREGLRRHLGSDAYLGGMLDRSTR